MRTRSSSIIYYDTRRCQSGTGVTIQFIFPSTVAHAAATPPFGTGRSARPHLLEYARSLNPGDSCVVHQQAVTFLATCGPWSTIPGMYYCFTWQPASVSRRLLINAESKRRGAVGAISAPGPPQQQQTAAEDDEEAELARAIAESLQTAAAEAAPVSACAAASSSTAANATAASSYLLGRRIE